MVSVGEDGGEERGVAELQPGANEPGPERVRAVGGSGEGPAG